MHVLYPLEAKRRQRPLDGLPLRIEDALLGPNQHTGPHGAERSSQFVNGSPAIRS